MLARAFPIVFMDRSGTINLTSRVSLGRYYELRHDATISVAALDDPVLDGFESLFMRPNAFYSRCDMYLRIPYTLSQLKAFAAASNNSASAASDTSALMQWLSPSLPTLNVHNAIARFVHSILVRAFTDRAHAVLVRTEYATPAPSAAATTGSGSGSGGRKKSTPNAVTGSFAPASAPVSQDAVSGFIVYCVDVLCVLCRIVVCRCGGCNSRSITGTAHVVSAASVFVASSDAFCLCYWGVGGSYRGPRPIG